MNTFDKFGAAINCIDGRVQAPVAEWLKHHCHLQFIDMITHPGADGVLANGRSHDVAAIAEKLAVSVKAHQTQVVAIVGHFDCAANGVGFDEHKEQIEKGSEIIKSWNMGVRVIGMYVNEWNSVDLICDTDDEIEQIRSFL